MRLVLVDWLADHADDVGIRDFLDYIGPLVVEFVFKSFLLGTRNGHLNLPLFDGFLSMSKVKSNLAVQPLHHPIKD